MNPIERRVAECRVLLLRAAALARALDPGHLAWTDPALGFGGVGAQLRHISSAYSGLLRADRDGVVDYDARARNLDWENDPEALSKALERIADALPGLCDLDPDAPLLVRMDEPLSPETGWTTSSVGRELRFLASHAVHHLAIVELLLRAQGIRMEERAPEGALGELVFAPSTPRPGA